MLRGQSDHLQTVAQRMLATRGVTHGGFEVVTDVPAASHGAEHSHGHEHPHPRAHAHAHAHLKARPGVPRRKRRGGAAG